MFILISLLAFNVLDELIDILDAEGNPTGRRCLKSVAHKNGYFHATVHLWLFTEHRKILLQKHSPNKKVFPNLWGISVAGHITAGERVLGGMLRQRFGEKTQASRSRAW